MDENLKGYADELRTLVTKSNESFEKQLNYISSGALGISMIVVEKVIKGFEHANNKWVVIISWILLGLTLTSNLLSHTFASKLHNKTLAEIQKDDYDYSSALRRNKEINNWNTISILFLLLGLTFQIIFIAINI